MTSTLNLEGKAVRVAVGNGAFLHADVQEVNEEQVKVRGRWFSISDVQTEEEIERIKKANIDAYRRGVRAEQEATKRQYSAEFLQLWRDAKYENLLRAQRVDLETALTSAYQENAMHDRAGRRTIKKAAVQWLISNTTEARLRLFEHVKATGALAIEPTPESLPRDSEWYTSLCGECFPEDNASVHIVPPLHHPRGTEYRVTFPIPEFELPSEFNYQTMFSGGSGRFTINSKELFEMMVKEGMRL